MKRCIAGILLMSIFGCGTFASYAADVGSKAKTELVKKSYDLVAIEVNQVIEVDPPAVQPTNYMNAEVNVLAINRPRRAVANSPPRRSLLENSPTESNRIRAVTR